MCADLTARPMVSLVQIMSGPEPSLLDAATGVEADAPQGVGERWWSGQATREQRGLVAAMYMDGWNATLAVGQVKCEPRAWTMAGDACFDHMK